ncbi:MAG: hypothetical protein AB7V16_01490 [Vulcanibacillus sp.]
MASFYEAIKAKEQISNKLLERKDILGIGVGYYNPSNPKDGAGIIVYSQEATAFTVAATKSITAKVNGKNISVPIRVVKNESFRPNNSTLPTNYKIRIRPVKAGYSIGTSQASGTAGIVVTNSKNNRLYVLSNNHVLNKNNQGSTDTIQPGGADGGKIASDKIGRVYQYVKLKKDNNYLDAAISIPLSNRLLSTKYAVIGTLKGHCVNYRIGDRFIKVGRTTGLVGGWVESINTDLKVNYGSYGGLGEVKFKNQTIIRSNMPISLPGDSGSVWIKYSNRYAAAVNYAGTADGKLSVSFPVHWAMQVFKTSIPFARGSSLSTNPLTDKELKVIKVLKK